MQLNKDNFININKKFDELLNTKMPSFEIIEGKIPILISAPHSVRQFRNGKIKAKDSYTGAIAIILQKEINCYCIYKTKNNNDDANYDLENNNYKEELLKIINKNKIKLLLDIHGASDRYGFGIDIATDNQINLNGKEITLKILKETLEEFKINDVVTDKIFRAHSDRTICKTISNRTKIPCIELEIARKYRNIEDFTQIKKMIKAIKESIIRINKII